MADLVLQGGTLLDGSGAEPEVGAVVSVVGDRITEVGGARRATRGERTVDVAGLTVLPGLIDAHSHFGVVGFGDVTTPAAVTAARIFRNCELALDAGFTTVRDTGGIDGGVARAVDLGLVRGPHIFPSGPVLCQTGGHGDFRPAFAPLGHHHHDALPGLASLSLPCDGPDAVRLAARTAFTRGATQLKVCVSGGVLSLSNDLEDAQFTVEELVAAVAEADARRTYVTAHAHGVAGIRNGLRAGVACFEHGTFLDEETAADLAAAGAALVPTFAVTRVLREDPGARGLTPAVVARLEEVEAAMATALARARRAGVTIGLGSDLVGPEQSRRGLELVIRSALEDAMAAIVAATSVNARILRCDDDRGTIAVGKRADMIAVDGDPLAEPTLFDDPRRIVLVIKDGIVVKDLTAG